MFILVFILIILKCSHKTERKLYNCKYVIITKTVSKCLSGASGDWQQDCKNPKTKKNFQ